jgi:hypothetical protein
MLTCDFKVIDYQKIRKIMKFEIRNLGLEFREAPSSFCNFPVEVGPKMRSGPISLTIFEEG